MNVVWPLLLTVSVLYAVFSGNADAVLGYFVSGAGEAIALLITLAGVYVLWSGILNIYERIGALHGLARVLSPVITWLFPSARRNEAAKEHIAANLAANMLGLGNAATPEGIAAVQELQHGEKLCADAGLFIIVNCSSVQLFPATVIAMRAALGSVNPQDIVLPALLTTAMTTLLGTAAGKAYIHLRKLT